MGCSKNTLGEIVTDTSCLGFCDVQFVGSLRKNWRESDLTGLLLFVL